MNSHFFTMVKEISLRDLFGLLWYTIFVDEVALRKWLNEQSITDKNRVIVRDFRGAFIEASQMEKIRKVVTLPSKVCFPPPDKRKELTSEEARKTIGTYLIPITTPSPAPEEKSDYTHKLAKEWASQFFPQQRVTMWPTFRRHTVSPINNNE